MRLSKLLLAGCVALVPALAQAGDFGNLAMASMFGYGGWRAQPTVVNNFTPPYFSMHPPVYYGERYYRPYGASPFAAWPQLQPNSSYSPRAGISAQAPVAVTIANPHYLPAGPEVVPFPAPAIEPAVAPSTAAPATEQPAAPSGAAPDVVQHQSGPKTIENPYFRDSAQYISRQ